VGDSEVLCSKPMNSWFPSHFLIMHISSSCKNKEILNRWIEQCDIYILVFNTFPYWGNSGSCWSPSLCHWQLIGSMVTYYSVWRVAWLISKGLRFACIYLVLVYLRPDIDFSELILYIASHGCSQLITSHMVLTFGVYSTMILNNNNIIIILCYIYVSL
jgi:hypothetical protein